MTSRKELARSGPSRRLAQKAIRAGKLTRSACEFAGPECSGEIQAHHDDYAKPLEVRWACRRHHARLDRERREAA